MRYVALRKLTDLRHSDDERLCLDLWIYFFGTGFKRLYSAIGHFKTTGAVTLK